MPCPADNTGSTMYRRSNEPSSGQPVPLHQGVPDNTVMHMHQKDTAVVSFINGAGIYSPLADVGDHSSTN